jgi:hypothetical protein
VPVPPRRRLKPHHRRALLLLAGCGTAHGFTRDQLRELVLAGFAAATIERVVGSAQTSEVTTFKITEAGSGRCRTDTMDMQNDWLGLRFKGWRE